MHKFRLTYITRSQKKKKIHLPLLASIFLKRGSEKDADVSRQKNVLFFSLSTNYRTFSKSKEKKGY